MSIGAWAGPGAKSPRTVPQRRVAVPRLLGESFYDRFTSMLMAIIAGAVLIVGWLGLVIATNQGFRAHEPARVELVEVFGGGGGSPEGQPESIEQVNVPGAEADRRASNNEDAATEFEEPMLRQTPSAALDAVLDSSAAVTEVDLDAPVPSGGPTAAGKRASRLGTGGPGLGFGPGDGGVPREQRWSILYDPGQTLEEYARQLDSLRVELATVQGNSMVYTSGFSSAEPTRRSSSGQGDTRLYFLWQSGARKGSDLELLRRAGIEVGERPIFQFYPKEVEEELSQLEFRFKGRRPSEIRFTRFRVVPNSDGYGFEVVAQQPLR